MSKILFKTLTNDTPNHKQKVYLCIHPSEFNQYFASVCEDIFKAFPECAIYYDSEPETSYDRDDLLLMLSNMQVFYVIVTEKLLKEHSRIRELDLPFALGRVLFSVDGGKAISGERYHIPVIPVMMDDALFDEFNADALFRETQALSRYGASETTLGFEEKLKRFLDAVLVSGEEQKKIKKEFRAKIFLSYRKTDRALAQKLMELVHRVSFCRDVSIWYDEYLIPGENWLVNVMEELKASDLFLLNVTSNLLKEGNFVFKKEYPAAVETGRPVLPAETEATDREKLEVMYEGTASALIQAEDESALESGLEEKLIKKAGKADLLRENNDPEHVYYIGLAYKNNIGMEANAARAVELLEKAGEGGYNAAWYTLGQMYEKGDSVARDEEKAISYYHQFIDGQKPDFGTSKDGDYRMLLAYDAIGMIYLRDSRLSEAFALYEELNGLLLGMTSCYGSFQAINLPSSFERLGSIRRAQGANRAAAIFFEKAQEERLHPRQIRNIATGEERKADVSAAETNEFGAKFGMAVNLYLQATTALENRNVADAKGKLESSRRLFEELSPKMNDVDLQENLSKVYYQLGTIAKGEYEAAKALDYFKKALGCADDAVKNERNYEARIFRAVILIAIGTYYRDSSSERNLSTAEAYFLDALKAVTEVDALDSTRRTKDMMAGVYEKLGSVYEMQQDLEKAAEYYEKDLEIQEQITKDTDQEPEFLRSLSIAYEKLANIYMHQGRYNPARLNYRKDEEICEKLAENPEDIRAQRDLSVCYDGKARLYEAWGKYEEALRYNIRGLVIANALIQNHTGVQEVDDYASSYYKIGCLCADVFSECLDCAIKNWQLLYNKTGEPVFKQRLDSARMAKIGTSVICPIPKGFTTGVRELIDRYAADLEAPGKFAAKYSGDFANNRKRKGGFNKVLRIVCWVVIICGILQLTGLVDITGFIKGLFAGH